MYWIEAIKRYVPKYVSPHLHASIAFLVEADENETLIVKSDENSGVKWIPINKMDLYSNEPRLHI